MWYLNPLAPHGDDASYGNIGHGDTVLLPRYYRVDVPTNKFGTVVAGVHFMERNLVAIERYFRTHDTNGEIRWTRNNIQDHFLLWRTTRLYIPPDRATASRSAGWHDRAAMDELSWGRMQLFIGVVVDPGPFDSLAFGPPVLTHSGFDDLDDLLFAGANDAWSYPVWQMSRRRPDLASPGSVDDYQDFQPFHALGSNEFFPQDFIAARIGNMTVEAYSP